MKKTLLAVVAFCSLAGASRPALADCSSKYWDSAKDAVKNRGLWSWYAAQIDCELNYVECQRIALIGR